MARYYQDDQGQWWYTWGDEEQYLQRAYTYQCEECGKDFHRRQKLEKPARFCSKSCSGKWQYKAGVQNVTASANLSPNWKGGIRKRGHRKVMVYAPDHPHSSDGYVWIHRLALEEVLGRPLEPDELVHHIDGDPTNNHPDNLQIVTISEHALIHSKTRIRNRKGQFLS